MKFINRENEINKLNEEYNKMTSFVVIYGRRRTGKTTLIKKFIEDKKALYFFADTQAETYQISRFKSQISDFLNDSLLEKIEFKDWDTLIEYFVEKIGNDKVVLVFDEFQYICKENKSFASIIQRIWDTYLSKKNVMLILCGSLIGMMYEHTLSYKSPLYGRRTAQIKLKQININDYGKFFEKIEPVDLVNNYSVTGGIPKYIEGFTDNADDIFENIRKNIINKNSYLYSEPRFLLKEEINEVSTYFSILQAISGGDHKIGKIAARLGLQVNNLTSFLSKLIDIDIITKEVPITESNPEKSKKGLYFVNDNFLKFWFRFVFPYESYLEIEQTDYVISKIKEDFNYFVSFVFEDVCRDRIRNLKLPFKPIKSGRWWGQALEIDIVSLGENDEVLFSECKWWDAKVGLNILENLEKKASSLLKAGRYKKIYYALFSKSGFSDDLLKLKDIRDDVLLFDLNDLFGD